MWWSLRDCNLWNTAALWKYIWQVAQKEDILWIRWVHIIYIKNKYWWDYVAPSSASYASKMMICRVKEKFQFAYYNNVWLDGSGGYSTKEGYKWLRGDMKGVRWHY